MSTEKIALRVSGMTEFQSREYDFPIGNAANEYTELRGLPARQNVRFSAGLLCGPSDLNPFRRKLKHQTPKCLKR